jgi:hypothetical protein
MEGTLRVGVEKDGTYKVEWAAATPDQKDVVGTGDERIWPPAEAPERSVPGRLQDTPMYFADPNTSHADLETLGKALRHFLLGGAAGRTRADAARAAGEIDLRTWLELPPELSPVPWESMLDRDGSPLFCSLKESWVRWSGPSRALVDRRADWPIRVLAVVAEAPGGTQAADQNAPFAQSEIEALEDVFWEHRQDFDLKVMRNVLLPDQLREEFRKFRPHIFHLIAHGTVAGGELAIAFPGDIAGARAWRVSDVSSDFKDDLPVPCLAVLNACRSSPNQQPVPVDESGIWSVAGAFLNRGVTALVSMQGDVLGTAAATFAIAFYKALAAGNAVDQAAAWGRLKMRQAHGSEPRQCSLPVVFADCSLAAKHLERPAREQSVMKRIRNTKEFSFVGKHFVDRDDERRTILKCTAPEGADDDRRSLIVLRGPAMAGKRFLAAVVAELLASRGSQVRRIAVHSRFSGLGPGDASWNNLLVELRWGFAGSSRWLEEPLDTEAFRDFDLDLHHLCKNPDRAPPLPNGDFSGVNMTRNVKWPKPAKMSEWFIEQVFKSFRRSLLTAASKERHILIFDELTDYSTHFAGNGVNSFGHLSQEPSWWPMFAEGLFIPVARGDIPNVTILLLMRDAEFTNFRPDDMGSGVVDVPLPRVPANEIYRVACQLYRRLCPEHWNDRKKWERSTGMLKKLNMARESCEVMQLWEWLFCIFGAVELEELPRPVANPFARREPEFSE